MNRIILFITALSLCGCAYHNHMLQRYDRDGENLSYKRSRTSYDGTSFWDLAKHIKNNAQPNNTKLKREGFFKINTKKYKEKLFFTWSYVNDHLWEFKVFDQNKKRQLLSLHKNRHGLTYQNIQDQDFIQSDDRNIWKQLSQTNDKRIYLQLIHSLLQSPKFDPRHNWLEETDGLKYYIITMIDEHPVEAVKHQLYFHKATKTIARHLKTTYQADFYDAIYNKYRHIESMFLPTEIHVKLALDGTRIDIDIHKTQLEPYTQKARELKEF